MVKLTPSRRWTSAVAATRIVIAIWSGPKLETVRLIVAIVVVAIVSISPFVRRPASSTRMTRQSAASSMGPCRCSTYVTGSHGDAAIDRDVVRVLAHAPDERVCVVSAAAGWFVTVRLNRDVARPGCWNVAWMLVRCRYGWKLMLIRLSFLGSGYDVNGILILSLRDVLHHPHRPHQHLDRRAHHRNGPAFHPGAPGPGQLRLQLPLRTAPDAGWIH